MLGVGVAVVLNVGGNGTGCWCGSVAGCGCGGIQVLVGMHSALPAEITAATLMVWLVVYTV